MRSIPRAGWAAHGFFGFAAKTFGNPSGATSGNGALVPPGPPAVTPVVWTFRNQPTSGGAPVFAMASDSSGHTVLVDTAGAVQQSTDGGHSWIGQGTIPGFSTTETRGMLMVGDTVWVLTGGNSSYRSLDVGTTWEALIGAPGSLGTNNAETWVAISATIPCPPADYGVSTDNGATWPQDGVTTIAGTDAFLPVVWDGTQFVLFSFDVTGTIPTIWSSPDGLTWTGSPSNTSVENWGFALFAGGVYYATDQQAANVYSGASIDAINNAAPVATNLTGGSQLLGRTAAGQSFAFDTVGNVANTAPGSFSSWVLGTPNFSQPGESGNQLCFDVVNNSLIVGGTAGSICTVP